MADVEGVVQFALVVCSHVQGDRETVRGVHSSACRVQSELANLHKLSYRDTNDLRQFIIVSYEP